MANKTQSLEKYISEIYSEVYCSTKLEATNFIKWQTFQSHGRLHQNDEENDTFLASTKPVELFEFVLLQT